MIKTELHSRPFGSTYDPVLNGIARGLADLYLPVEQPSSFADASGPHVDCAEEQDEDGE